MPKQNRLALILFFVLLFFNQALLNAQNLAIKTVDAFCQEQGAVLTISDIVEIEGPDNDLLEGIQIAVTDNFNPNEDSFTYTFADDIQGDFDPQNAIFTLSGEATILEYKAALDRLEFNSDPDNVDPKTINITLSGVDFFVESGHFYQFFPDVGISWLEAKTNAENQELFGLQGYLTTITTSGENQFILDRVSGTAWIGASDEQNEGVWRWITGPEKDQNGGLGMLLSAGFTNWNDGEPNNAGDEDYAHMMDWSTPAGRWNDLPNAGGGGQYAPTGYIVEYGGRSGDPNILDQISGNTILERQRDIEVIGPSSVCPNVEGVIYNATALDAHTYIWTIEGGVILNGRNTDEITVKWGDTNANASVKVIVTSDLACSYQEVLNVRINEKLEPPAPVGLSAICFDDLNDTHIYKTPATPGSTYTWNITNGQIISGNGTNEIEVIWDQPGIGQLYFTESTSTSTDICDGDSPTIDIILREEILIDLNLDHVSCFGGNDGGAQLSLISQADNFSLEWIVPNSATIENDQVNGLSAGNYEVLVRADGCQKYFSFQITEPQELIGDLDLINVRCFGESNGSAQANITGGTGAYNFQWSHDQNQSTASVHNLPEGEHSVRIVDENNCELILNFTITEPDLLVIDEVISTLVSCPGGSDGTLEALVSGGTRPYTFIWEENSSSSDLATGYAQGDYSVKVIDANGCEANNNQSVEAAIPKVVLPNAFTPNGDNLNDTFGPTTPCGILFKMEIYNRWGQVIFSTNSSTDQWDGTFQGNPVESGKYTYAAS